MTFLLNRAFFLLIFASCISGSAIAVELERRALVIANAEYSELSRLPASKHDGVGFTALLRDKGYDVTFDEAGDSGEAEKLHASWTGFIKQVGNFEKSGIAVVYFSGHGVEIDNDSYLLPIDLSANASEAEVRLKGLSVRKMYREFKEHQTRLKDEKGITLHGLFIFDACRTAFAENSVTKGAAGSPGLVPVAPPPGIFVMYAASAGQVAHTTIDQPANPETGQTDQTMSVYTQELKKIFDEAHSLQTTARLVRWQVHRLVASRPQLTPQTPAYFDELNELLDIRGEPISEDERKLEEEHQLNEPALGVQSQLAWECESCPRLRVVPADSYLIGSPKTEKDHNANEESATGEEGEEQLRVTIARSFAIGVSEITREQYRAFLTDGGKPCPPEHDACNLGQHGSSKPVTGVSWKEANAYVAWLNEELYPGGSGPYRLPTEAEWEYAARAGQTAPYVFGEDEKTLCYYGNGADLSLNALFMINWHCSDGRARDTASIESYKPNAFGLHDVHGNVWEWVADCWEEKHSPAKANGGMFGAANDGTCRRVARGGSWLSAPAALRLASRTHFDAGGKRQTLGFRIARSLTDKEIAAVKANSPGSH